MPVDRGGELRELVEPSLVSAPVIAGAPVRGQLLQVPQRHPPAPADAGQLVGPAGAGQAVAQVVQVGLGDGDPEGPDRGVGAAGAGRRRGRCIAAFGPVGSPARTANSLNTLLDAALGDKESGPPFIYLDCGTEDAKGLGAIVDAVGATVAGRG